VLPDANCDAVLAAAEATLGDDLDELIGCTADEVPLHLSNAFRDFALAVPDDGTGVHPTLGLVNGSCARALFCMDGMQE
jgi:hypothetical protein